MENTSSNNHSAAESSPAAATTSNGQAAPALTNGHSHVVNEQNAALLPQLETFERMMKLPVVEAAWHQSQDVYGKVKGKWRRSRRFIVCSYCWWFTRTKWVL